MAKVAIIGGGAAGFWAAITTKTFYPDLKVCILEKTSKYLSKVKVSGGGRCNVTHACFEATKLSQYYPRGGKALKKVFRNFMPQDMMAWLEKRGVGLKTESDGRVFPQSDDSQTIIDCFLKECRALGIELRDRNVVEAILPQSDGGFLLQIAAQDAMEVDKVIVCSGGSPKLSGLDWLKDLGHQIVAPVPSLFTFNMPTEPIRELMGLSNPESQTKVQGSKLREDGPLLITHWGMSGPSILKLSAWGARELAEKDYTFRVMVNWRGGLNEALLRAEINEIRSHHPQKKIKNQHLQLPKRLWAFLLEKSGIDSEKNWGDLSKKDINRLLAHMSQDVYEVKGKTTFKDEFVTCGGVSLEDIMIKRMESKVLPNLFFAGEVLDIDGVTGGFNFQAAWTTAFVAGKAVGAENSV